jgi:hypothetical protein
MIKKSSARFYRVHRLRWPFAALLACTGFWGCEQKKEAPEKTLVPQQASAQVLEGDAQVFAPQQGGGLAAIAKMVTQGQLPDNALLQLEREIDMNPQASAEWAAPLPLGSNRDTCLELVFGKWGEIDAPAAIDFVRKNLAGMDRTVAAASIAESMAAESPESSSAALALVTEPVPRAVVVRSAVAAAFETNQGRAVSWSLAQSSPAEREAALMALTEIWSQRDPQSCAAWVVSVLKGDDKTTAASELMAGWGRISPRDAAQWLDAQKSVIDYEEVAPVLAENWSLVDPKAAANWAGQEKDPEIRSSLMETIVSIWVLNEAANSIDWASGIQDTELRKSFLESAFMSLAMESPSALADWIKNNSGHAAIHDAKEVQAGFE